MFSDSQNSDAPPELGQAHRLMAEIRIQFQGDTVTPVRASASDAVIAVKRKTDAKTVNVAYTLADALQAGHFEEPESREWWTRHTADMNYAAAVRRVHRRFFPELRPKKNEAPPESVTQTLGDPRDLLRQVEESAGA